MPQYQLKVQEKQSGFKSLVSEDPIPADSKIIDFYYQELMEQADRYTIQLGENKHFDPKPDMLRYTNHSCAPNVFFDFENMDLISLKAIEAGEPLLFFYPSTEWKMEEAFNCNCGSSKCLGLIKGAKYISPEVLSKYRLSTFIENKLK